MQARVFGNVTPALRVRNVSAFCERAPMYGEARWYRRYKDLEPVLDIAQSEQYEGRLFC